MQVDQLYTIVESNHIFTGNYFIVNYNTCNYTMNIN